MPDEDDFWLPRQCFVPPLPEHALAAELLSQACDALILGDSVQARSLLAEADFPALHHYAFVLMNSESKSIHRIRKVPGLPAPLSKITQRMPGAAAQRALFARDGYRCRFCGCRVVLPKARDRIRLLLPGCIRFSEQAGFHAAFYALSASIDHIVPHSRGGTNEMENLVVACWSCQFGRGGYLLEEVGLIDPRTRAPVVDDWDGLGRILALSSPHSVTIGQPSPAQAPTHSHLTSGTPKKSTPAKNTRPIEWFSEINHLDSGQSEQLRRLLDSLSDLDVSWSINKILMVKLSSAGGDIGLMGILPDGKIEIPWMIGNRKQEFRLFAEYLSAGIEGSRVRESPKLWIVEMPDKSKISVQQLLQARPSLRVAIKKLRATLST